MIKLKTITDKYRSVYAAAKALNVNPIQLGRWLAKDAYIDDEGSPYIKTKGVIDMHYDEQREYDKERLDTIERHNAVDVDISDYSAERWGREIHKYLAGIGMSTEQIKAEFAKRFPELGFSESD